MRVKNKQIKFEKEGVPSNNKCLIIFSYVMFQLSSLINKFLLDNTYPSISHSVHLFGFVLIYANLVNFALV